jgi:hypothetical protein
LKKLEESHRPVEVVNTIPSDSNFGKKDKMVRVSQTLDGKEANDQEVHNKLSTVGHNAFACIVDIVRRH